MTDSHSITNADEAKIIDWIHRAEHRIVYLAPGITQKVAEAISVRWKQMDPNAVSVILDVDPEVCRLGFGTIEGLLAIRAAAQEVGALVCHQPGVRIGLLVSDQATLIYTPTPLLIEAGSTQPERPNAIVLGFPPVEIARDMGLGDAPDRERVVGLDPILPDQIDKVAANLKAAPPVKFDLARRVRVFTSRFQFVELEMTGCFISRKKVAIPSSLVGLERDRDVESQFHAHFNLVQQGQIEVATDKGRKITEQSLSNRRKEIENAFLIALKGYGMVLLRANKERFEKDVEELKADVAMYAKGVVKQLQAQMDTSRKKLVEALFPSVKRNPPDSYTKLHGKTVPDDFLRQRLDEDITTAFGAAAELVKQMQVKVVFKDVAYESLVDTKFMDIAKKALKGASTLFDECDAVTEKE